MQRFLPGFFFAFFGFGHFGHLQFALLGALLGAGRAYCGCAVGAGCDIVLGCGAVKVDGTWLTCGVRLSNCVADGGVKAVNNARNKAVAVEVGVGEEDVEGFDDGFCAVAGVG